MAPGPKTFLEQSLPGLSLSLVEQTTFKQIDKLKILSKKIQEVLIQNQNILIGLFIFLKRETFLSSTLRQSLKHTALTLSVLNKINLPVLCGPSIDLNVLIWPRKKKKIYISLPPPS